MQYLFFDIECAGVFKNVAKICAFGYLLVNENFDIVKKEDLLINPQGHFHLTDRKGEKGLVLPYKYEDFKKYPTFPQLADKIYSLLHAPDTLVVGHAVSNDVKYLNLESRRFSLPSFAFRFADTQFVYMNKVGEFSRQFGLGTIAAELGVEFTAHKAVDDAYATMRVAQEMCREENCTFYELLNKYQIDCGYIADYEITPTDSAAQREYKIERERQKEAREKARAAFHVFADREKRKRAKDGKLKGKRICFSHALELQTSLAQKLLSATFNEAGFHTYQAEDCDVYVCYESESGARLQSAKQKNARVFTPEAYAAYLGL